MQGYCILEQIHIARLDVALTEKRRRFIIENPIAVASGKVRRLFYAILSSGKSRCSLFPLGFEALCGLQRLVGQINVGEIERCACANSLFDPCRPIPQPLAGRLADDSSPTLPCC